MDRCVVLVDAGYLLGAAASLLAGEPARSRITVDHAALIQGLRERAEDDTERRCCASTGSTALLTGCRSRNTAGCG